MMFKSICCIILCFAFPLVIHADDNFRQALDKGDVDVVKTMLAKDPNLLKKPIAINASVKKSPLLYVVKKHGMLRLLLAAGADPNSDGLKPLRFAILSHDLESVRILLDAGAKIAKAKENSVESPLETAAREGCLEIVKELLDRGTSPDDGQALGIAIGAEHWQVVKLLLGQGADPNHGDAFLSAAERAPLDIVKLMLEHGAEANAQSYYGGALAKATGDLEKVKLLVASGADVNGSYRKGRRALHSAAGRGNADVVAFLLDQNAEVNIQRKEDNRTPLDLAVVIGDKEVIKLLLDAGAERTLHAEVALGNVEKVKAALEDGADVNLAIVSDYAPQLIHTAIKFEQIEMLELLISKKADVDATIGDVSAIHQAVSQRSVELVKVLLAAGANANATLFATSYGRGDLTPLHFVVEEMNRRGVQAEKRLASGSDEIDLTIAKLLLDNGADPTLQSELGETPLQMAKRLGKTHFVQLLDKSRD